MDPFVIIISFLAGALIATLVTYILTQKSRTLLSHENNRLGLLLEQGEKNEKERQKNIEQMEQQFKILAQKIFDEKTQLLKKQSEQELQIVVNPLKERVTEFQKKVEEIYFKDQKERSDLQAQLSIMIDLNKKLSEDADSLTQALKGDVKAQGNWGEFVLEKILERSGLRQGSEYISQGSDLKLSDEEGHRQMPDVIIMLPEDKHLIVDAKMSLASYQNYTTTSDEKSLKDFMKSLTSHVDNLASKKYHHLDKLLSPDFVILFVPIEGAFALALQKDQSLFQYAWDKKIVIVSPTTLLATLKTVESIWRRERVHQNYDQLAKSAGQLYDKFVGLYDEILTIESQFSKVEQSFSTVKNRLREGKGNLLSRVDKLRVLGAQTSKELPTDFEED
ncbi:MAG: DNA recombination protein RmuC [Bacteriovoracaceae bacterium]